MAQAQRALLVFTRSPEAEARAKGFAPGTTAALFAAMLRSWERVARAAGARLLISSPSRCSRRLRRAGFREGTIFLEQDTGGFGDRVAGAVAGAFSLGFSAVAIVPGDTPAISPEETDRVFAAIEGPDSPVVVGPSEDGGIYLIGLPRLERSSLAAIRLRDVRACRELVSTLRNAGKRVLLLDPRGEVDSAADLRRAYRASAASSVWSRFRRLLVDALSPRAGEPPRALAVPDRPPLNRLPARAPPAA